MAQPDSAYGTALRRFRKRRLYANLVGDFMVPFGTAAIEGGEYGAGIGDGRLARRFVNRPDASYRDESVCKGEASGVGVICEQRATIAGGEAGDYEEMMRSGLSTVSWEKVGVGFKGATTFTPLAHNKLPALRREGWRRAFEWVEKAYEGTGGWSIARDLLWRVWTDTTITTKTNSAMIHRRRRGIRYYSLPGSA